MMLSKITRRFSTKVLTPEVCIVGGGPAGAALSCALSSSSHFGKGDVLLIDSSKLPSLSSYDSNLHPDRKPEPRVVTLTPSSLNMLDSMGVLQRCDHKFITPFSDMIVYEEAGSAYMHFNNEK